MLATKKYTHTFHGFCTHRSLNISPSPLPLRYPCQEPCLRASPAWSLAVNYTPVPPHTRGLGTIQVLCLSPLLPAAITEARRPVRCGLVPVDVAETLTHLSALPWVATAETHTGPIPGAGAETHICSRHWGFPSFQLLAPLAWDAHIPGLTPAAVPRFTQPGQEVRVGPLQSYACSFLMAHQWVTGDFWSLALFPLPVVSQLCVSGFVCCLPLCLLSPLHLKGPWLDGLNKASALTPTSLCSKWYENSWKF